MQGPRGLVQEPWDRRPLNKDLLRIGSGTQNVLGNTAFWVPRFLVVGGGASRLGGAWPPGPGARVPASGIALVSSDSGFW